MKMFKVPIQKDEEQRIGEFFVYALNNKKQEPKNTKENSSRVFMQKGNISKVQRKQKKEKTYQFSYFALISTETKKLRSKEKENPLVAFRHF